MKKVLVIGGGLAGLTAASLLTQKGYHVTLLEKMSYLGGRCSTLEKDAFRLNFGAHAVYGRDRSYMQKVLTQLGLSVSWSNLNPDKVRYELAENELTVTPITLPGIWKTKLFPKLRDKTDFLRSIITILLAHTNYPITKKVGEWIDEQHWNSHVKHFLLHLAGTNFFTKQPENIPLHSFLSYYKRIFLTKYPVSYIQGGWSALVNQFIHYLNEHGATIKTKTSVNQILFEGDRVIGVMAGKETFAADSIIFCIPPLPLQKLVIGTPLYQKASPYLEANPNTVVVYDVALKKRIRSDISYVSDLKNHLFITDPSLHDPDCAPKGAQLLQAIAYTTPEEIADKESINDLIHKMEELFDRHYPGWRENLAFKRITEQATVQAAVLSYDVQRLPIQFNELPNCFFAGDWCVGEGTVSDIAFYSAFQVATHF